MKRMPVVLVSLRESPSDSTGKQLELIFFPIYSHIKGKPSHKIVSDGKFRPFLLLFFFLLFLSLFSFIPRRN